MDRQRPLDLRVFVVAGDPLARAGLVRLLAETPGLSPVGDAPAESDRAGALFQADVVLWDLGPGADPVSVGELQHVDPPVVVLLPDDALVQQVLAAGVQGVLLRSAEPEMIMHALVAAEVGLLVIDPDLAERALALRESEPEVEALTPRESEVLHLLAEGLPNKLIADRLAISENTVKFHVSSVLSKLGAHSRTEAVMRAARQGLLVL